MGKEKKLSHSGFLEANRDSRKAAEAADLVYVNGNTKGFIRKKKGKGFIYFDDGKLLKDEKHLERIRRLAIPPSWTNVWICASPSGHIQATGTDLRGRKQYRYHARWNELRRDTKFHHLYEFGKMLPRLRRRIKRDLRSKKLTQQKVLAAALDLMDKTYIRIGNESYEKENQSYGLATLKDHHVSLQREKLTFSFNGKKGVKQTVTLKNKKLARIIKQCRDIPGKALFQYYDEENNPKAIDSSLLNNYIKEATAPWFSAKDIRTWAGSVQAVQYLAAVNSNDEPDDAKTLPAMLDWVSDKLGNSRNICKKYYIHPSLISFCEEKRELAGLQFLGKNAGSFSKSEGLLMCVLRGRK